MRLSVIVCTWNRCEDLAKALNSLVCSRFPAETDWEILVVDNNSKDSTRTVCENLQLNGFPGLRYLFEPQQGKSFALNTGIREARGEYIAFTDDDVTVDPNWCARLLDTFDSQRCTIIGGRIVAVWEVKKPDWYSETGPDALMKAIVSYNMGESICEVKNPPFGANLAIHRDVFLKHGYFRTDLGPTGGSSGRGEDTEFCLRVLAAGERIIYDPNAIVYHPVEPIRTTKAYFRRWYYDYGRSAMIQHGLPSGTPLILGIPRFKYRQLAHEMKNWILGLDHPRFYSELQICRIWGEMAELRNLGGLREK